MILKNLLMKLLLVIAIIAIPGAVFAEDILNANDLKKTSEITAPMKAGKFTITGTSDKFASIDATDSAVSASDGQIFNLRINLKGAGNADARSVKFSAKKGSEIKIYIQSSSRSDSRIMKLFDAKGAVIAELTGAPLPATSGDPTTASIVTAKIPADGDYYLASASGGMYIYMLSVK